MHASIFICNPKILFLFLLKQIRRKHYALIYSDTQKNNYNGNYQNTHLRKTCVLKLIPTYSMCFIEIQKVTFYFQGFDYISTAKSHTKKFISWNLLAPSYKHTTHFIHSLHILHSHTHPHIHTHTHSPTHTHTNLGIGEIKYSIQSTHKL